MKFDLFALLFNIGVVALFILINMWQILRGAAAFDRDFWIRSLIVVGGFSFILIFWNSFYLSHRRYARLSDAKDWRGMANYLEQQIYERRNFRGLYIGTLVTSYMLLAEPENIHDLEVFFRRERPAKLLRFPLYFGIFHFLSDDLGRVEAYFDSLRRDRRCRKMGWVTWAYAFTIMRRGNFMSARTVLLNLNRRRNDALLRLLVLYLLNTYAPSDPKVGEVVTRGLQRYRRRVSRRRMARFSQRSYGSILTILLSRIIADATRWVLGEQPA